MKILWVSNACWTNTGYGVQSRIFVPRLQQRLGHEMQVLAFYGLDGSTLSWQGIPHFPKFQHPYGMDIAHIHAKRQSTDLIMTLMDSWVCEPERLQSAGVPWVPWFPVDMDPLSPAVARVIKQAFALVVFSKYGQKTVADHGLDSLYVPHGIDRADFYPVSKTKARNAIGWSKQYGHDRFIVGMVAANKGNPSRKNFNEQLLAFRAFKDEVPDALLYLHTTSGTEHMGVNLIESCVLCGLKPQEDVIFCDQYQYLLGFDNEYMRNMYSSLDVLLSVSAGEGFGVPILEAQACGTPVIVGEWTAMPELVYGGWLVPRESAYPIRTPLQGFQFLPDSTVVAAALVQAHQVMTDQKDRKTMKEKAARIGVDYDADMITDVYWKPALEEIEHRIQQARKATTTIIEPEGSDVEETVGPIRNDD